VLATGQGDVLRQKLGMNRRVVFPKQSLTFGFSVRSDGAAARFPALTYYGEHPRDRIDYLTLLPLGDSLRANLFTFCDHRDRWARAFRDDPKRLLLQVMPGLTTFLPDFDVVGKVQLFMMDLSVVDDHVRDGAVLIGDAFQTSCPAAGTGVSRLLVDVDRLCNVHVPAWLGTPGMGSDKIARFYSDPVKRAADTRASRAAEFRRALTVETSVRWKLRRREMYLRRRTLGWIAEHVFPRRRAAATR
jgi:2-polyprenyl-6-methoxyphenol hydroxylase-like FAD-dependent oxidoreductase